MLATQETPNTTLNSVFDVPHDVSTVAKLPLHYFLSEAASLVGDIGLVKKSMLGLSPEGKPSSLQSLGYYIFTATNELPTELRPSRNIDSLFTAVLSAHNAAIPTEQTDADQSISSATDRAVTLGVLRWAQQAERIFPHTEERFAAKALFTYLTSISKLDEPAKLAMITHIPQTDDKVFEYAA